MENQKLDKMREEIRQKQIATIKEAVILTLKKLNELEKQKHVLQSQINILKHDLFDLKDGRLDRVLERQSINEEVKTVSVFVVVKLENALGTPLWYENYNLCVKQAEGSLDCQINNSLTKTHASGSYKMENGSFKYL